MDKIILWFLLALGIALFIFSLRKQPIKNWLLAFLVTSYFSIFLGKITVINGMIKYPTRFLSHYFPSNILYELLLLPVISIYFYQTSYRSGFIAIIIQCILYTSGLTIAEIVIERYTNLVEYLTWNWLYTFIGVFCVMLIVRFLMKLINRESE